LAALSFSSPSQALKFLCESTVGAIGTACGEYPIDWRDLYDDAQRQIPMDQGLVQELVRLRLKNRRLPERGALRLRETFGDGQQCDACDEPISPKQTAVVVMVSLEWMSVRFHVDCYKVWDAERLVLSEKNGNGRAAVNDDSRR
jgi:hypothetical protein